MGPSGGLSASRRFLEFALVADACLPIQGRKETTRLLSFFRDDEGQGLVEYALIIAVIAIAVIVAMIFLRGQLQNIFSNIGNNLT